MPERTAKKRSSVAESGAAAPGRLPPQSLEAEMSTLGSMVLDVECIGEVVLLLRMEEEGISIPLEEAWDMQTVGDAYRLYTRHARRPRGTRSLPSTP